MKKLLFGLMLCLIGGCASVNETVVTAKAGVLLCPQMGAVPFKGNVTLAGNFAIIQPADTSRFRKLAVPDCIVMVTSEKDSSESEANQGLGD